ncbi:MAG: DNA polymerase I [Pseudohongiellaceae bacterium]
MTTKKELILVDGSSYLFRAFHALPPLVNRKGQPTGAVKGVVNMVRSLLRAHPETNIGIVFDAKGETFRNRIYADYKANRPPMPDELRSQIAPIHEIIKAMGLPLLIIDDVEADDVIGTLAVRATEAGIKTLISTGDKDLAQLVNDKVTLINTMTNEVLDIAGVEGKFQVKPERIVDYLALMGDKSDNIPGVPSVGPKTAVKWLHEYGSMEGVIENAEKVGGKVGEKLRDNIEQLRLSYELATIKTDVELELEIDSLKIEAEDQQRLYALFTELEFRTWINELERKGVSAPAEGEASGKASAKAGSQTNEAYSQTSGKASSKAINQVAEAGGTGDLFPDSAPAKGTSTKKTAPTRKATSTKKAAPATEQTPSKDIPPPQIDAAEINYHYLTDKKEFTTWLTKLNAAPQIALSIEHTGEHFLNQSILGIAVALEPGKATYIPLAHSYVGCPTQLPTDWVLKQLKPLLENPNITKLGWDIKHTLHLLQNHNITLQPVKSDVLLASYVVNSVAINHALGDIARNYLNLTPTNLEEMLGKGRNKLSKQELPLDTFTHYAAEQADFTLRLTRLLEHKMEIDGHLAGLYRYYEIPLIEVLQRIERNGIKVNPDNLDKQSRSLAKQLKKIEDSVFTQAGESFNLGSPKQLQAILYEKLQLPILKKTKTGQPSTAEPVLHELAAEYELPQLILEHRSLSKLKSTYTDKLPLEINEHTGRIHSTFQQAVAATGRLSSTDPNLQNIPIRTEAGRRVRQAFICEPGYKLLTADYSQVELRIMAHLSRDPGLLEAFSQAADVHRATAAEVFKVSLDAVTPDQRRSAKAINFGLIYGMSAFGLANQLNIERREAQEYVTRYFERYPDVRKYMEETQALADEKGYVETLFGRRLYLPHIRAGNAVLRKAAQRTAINAPMQGTAADIIKRAMIDVDHWLALKHLDARMILQVHDELIFEVAEADIELLTEGVKFRMMSAASLDVPLVVGIGVGDNWDEAH